MRIACEVPITNWSHFHPFPRVPDSQNKLFPPSLSFHPSLPLLTLFMFILPLLLENFYDFFNTQIYRSYDLFLCETFPDFSYQSRLHSSLNMLYRLYYSIYLIEFVFALCYLPSYKT